MRYQNISDMARMFDMSRETIRTRLKKAGVQPAKRDHRRVPLYDLAQAGPAIFNPRA